MKTSADTGVKPSYKIKALAHTFQKLIHTFEKRIQTFEKLIHTFEKIINHSMDLTNTSDQSSCTKHQLLIRCFFPNRPTTTLIPLPNRVLMPFNSISLPCSLSLSLWSLCFYVYFFLSLYLYLSLLNRLTILTSPDFYARCRNYSWLKLFSRNFFRNKKHFPILYAHIFSVLSCFW